MVGQYGVKPVCAPGRTKQAFILVRQGKQTRKAYAHQKSYCSTEVLTAPLTDRLQLESGVYFWYTQPYEN
jgi:hypothetical protein